LRWPCWVYQRGLKLFDKGKLTDADKDALIDDAEATQLTLGYPPCAYTEGTGDRLVFETVAVGN